jgi:hypothetical protein
MAHTLKLTNYNPVVFNTGLGLLRKQYSRRGATSLPNTTNANTTIGNGVVLYKKKSLVETPCYLQVFDYTSNTVGPYAEEKVLYVVFRGTVSIKSGLADVNAGLMEINKLLETVQMGGSVGTAVFQNEIGADVTLGVDSFSAHRGFVDNLLPVMTDICNAIEDIVSNESLSGIIVTGHSLRGANATLASLVLAGFKRSGLLQPRLCIVSHLGHQNVLQTTLEMYSIAC